MRFGGLHAKTQRILLRFAMSNSDLGLPPGVGLRFKAISGGRVAIWEIAFAFGSPLIERGGKP